MSERSETNVEVDRVVIGRLVLNGWEGITFTDVEVIGETPKRYRIRAITDTRLAGRCRTLKAGDTALVPKYAVRDSCDICNGANGGVPGNENREYGRLICDYCHAARWLKNIRSVQGSVQKSI